MASGLLQKLQSSQQRYVLAEPQDGVGSSAHSHSHGLATPAHKAALFIPDSTMMLSQVVREGPQYAVLFDAGSTGTRVHVFQYTLPAAAGQYADVQLPSQQHRVTPGLSSFAPDGEGVPASLEQLIEFAKQQVGEG